MMMWVEYYFPRLEYCDRIFVMVMNFYAAKLQQLSEGNPPILELLNDLPKVLVH